MSDQTTMRMREIAALFVRRANAQEMTGRARDKAAMEFFCGALAVAEVTNDAELVNALGLFSGFLLAPRGYSEVVKLATGE